MIRLRSSVHYMTFALLFACCGQALRAQKLPVNNTGFIENKGQVVNQDGSANSDVLFILPGNGFNVQLRKTGYSYDFFSFTDVPPLVARKTSAGANELLRVKIKTARIDVDLKDASPVQVETGMCSTDVLNYYTNGNSITDVHSFQKVIYKNIYPSIDIEFCTAANTGTRFKYNIILHPGADLKNVRLLVKGNEKMNPEADGSLLFATSFGTISESIPHSYYTGDDRTNVPVSFLVKKDLISFSAAYDHSRTFVIDPSSNRIWGTFYGDAGTDYCTSTGSDANNNIYISGYTLSTNNIATNGTYQSTLYSNFDVYLVKFNSAGVRTWGTYFGGNSVDAAYGMFVEANGNVYICGDTFSTVNVASTGAHQTTYGGGIDDALLVKFDPNGQRKWSTYYGGTLHDIAAAVTMDNSGNVIITGHTESNTGIATNSSYQNFNAGQFDVFVVKFDSLGVRQWGTYYGDSQTEEGFGVSCDAGNDIFVCGFSLSTLGISTNGSHQQMSGGMKDGFVAKFNPSGTTLLWGSYYGGTANDECTAIKIDNSGNIFLGGNTASANAIATTGSFQPVPSSADDAFLVRFNNAGVRQWATYVGGNDVDYLEDLRFDAAMKLLLAGSTISTTAISTPGAWQPFNTSPNNYDAYIMRFKNTGVKEMGTYYGGSFGDFGRGITTDNSGKIYLAGETDSADSIATPGSHMPMESGGTDGFLAKFCLAEVPVIAPSGIVSLCEGDSLTLFSPGTWQTYSWSNGSTVDSAYIPSSTLSGTYYYTVTTSDPTGCSTTSDTTTVVIDVCIGIAPHDQDLSFSVYPVPANSFLHIHLPPLTNSSAVIRIYDMNGKIVLEKNDVLTELNLPVKELPPGMYILKTEVNDRIFERKFLKD